MSGNHDNKVENLDALISSIAFEIVNEGILDENEINKLLRILSNNGVYAMWIYTMDKLGVKFTEDCASLKEERLFKFLSKIAEIDKFISRELDFEQLTTDICKLTKEINNLDKEIKKLRKEKKEADAQQKLKKKEQKEKERNNKLTGYFINISNNLHKLLFLKQLLEKTLIYARYHARAMGED